MLLQLATWSTVEAYLERSRALLIPLGSTEQHGRDGLIGTDALCAEAIARRVGERAGALVAPTITVGMAQFNLAFPGTITTRPSTLMALVEDYIVSLARQGFSHFYFLNGHGGNIAPVRAAIQEVHAQQSLSRLPDWPIRCRVRSWWEGAQVNALRRQLYGEGEGFHVTPSEIALTMALHPDHIAAAEWGAAHRLEANPLVDPAGDNHYDAAEHRQRYADGRVGSDPARATAAQGRQLLDAAVEDFTRDYTSFAAAGL